MEQAIGEDGRLIKILLGDSDAQDVYAASLLHHRIELLLSDDNTTTISCERQQQQKDDLLQELGSLLCLNNNSSSSSNLGYSSPGELKEALKSCYASIFDKKVRYATCKPFPPELAVLVDLTFLPDDFFSPTNHPEIKKHYEKMVVKPRSNIGTFRGSMNYEQARSYGCGFSFGGKKSNTDFFVQILDHFLIKYGGKDGKKEAEVTTTSSSSSTRSSSRQRGRGRQRGFPTLQADWSLGFLSTVLERQQDPHMDFEHAMIDQYKKMTGNKSRNCRGEMLLPWSFDMPLTDGGLRLAFYGIDDPNDPGKLLEIPVELCIPPKHVLLWRGDCIHSGSLLDRKGRSGFRIHGCLPLAPGHVGCGKPSTIEWSEKSRKANGNGGGDSSSGLNQCRYSQRLKKLDGSAFEEDDEVRYAEDVVEKFGLETSTRLWKIRYGERTKKARFS